MQHYILERGADDLFVLKDNQKDLTEEVEVYFQQLFKFKPDAAPDFRTVTGDDSDARKKVARIQHGRHEVRDIWTGDKP